MIKTLFTLLLCPQNHFYLINQGVESGTLERLRFTFTANVNCQTQVENFSE